MTPSLLAPLRSDARIELLVADTMDPRVRALASRLPVVLLITPEEEPLNALLHFLTAGLRAHIVVAASARFRAQFSDVKAAGAIECFSLPFSRGGLIRLIRLMQTRPSPCSVDSHSRLILDPIEQEAHYRDQRVRLTQREFALLHCLVSSEGQPVFGGELFACVWGEKEPRSKQMLAVYVFQLRRKLERIGLRNALINIRGFGYVLTHVPDNGASV